MMPSNQTLRRWFKWMAAVWIALMIYCLSIGPAVYVAERTHSDKKPLETVYWPLSWLHDNTPLQQPLKNYVNLWEDLALDVRR
jgi:hypothetical protein